MAGEGLIITVAALIFGNAMKKKTEGLEGQHEALQMIVPKVELPVNLTSPAAEIMKSVQMISLVEEPVVLAPKVETPTTPSPVDIPATSPVTSPMTSPVIEPSVSEPIIPISTKAVPLVAVIERTEINPDTALGGNIFKDIERSVRKEFSRTETRVRKELSRFETSVRKELSRFETSVRKEWGRFEKEHLDEVLKVVITVAKFLPGPIAMAAWAVYAARTYDQITTAQRLQKQIAAQEEEIKAINTDIEYIMGTPQRSAVTKLGGVIGFLSKYRLSSAFVPLLRIRNPKMQDSFVSTPETLPSLVSAGYEVGDAVGYISTVEFSDSAALKLMYNYELLEFVAATAGSPYMKNLVDLGYVEVIVLGYLSKRVDHPLYENISDDMEHIA